MILRDPVHGLVSFETEESSIVPRLLGTREVQRLRRIRQLGLTSFAFPGAEHTRFSHAVGAAHVMQLLLARLRQIDGALPFWQRPTSERGRDAIAAALLHDVGHGPFSHLFEEVLHVEHEIWTTRILLDPESDVHRVLVADDPGLPQRVAELVAGRHDLPYLGSAVSGTFDVDRCDYLLRDARATGVTYGDYDLPWLLRSLRFDVSASGGAPPSLAVDGIKGITAIESFLLARLFMFQQVYFHKSTRAAETMIRLILRRAQTLLEDGARLPTVLPVMETVARGRAISLEDYLSLDDQVLLVAMRSWEAAADPILSDLATRLSRRALFKTIELGNVESDRSPDDALAIARDIAVRRGLDPDLYVAIDRAADTPFPKDSGLVVVFPDGRRKALAEVSFLLGRLEGETLARTRLIFASELREELQGALGC
jgi:HD superfamily phosphohydrolase